MQQLLNIRDGAVPPIPHLNGYKIANPTILARIPAHELRSLFIGCGYEPSCGYEPLVVAGKEPTEVCDEAIEALSLAC